jgi:hypothetical protein
MCWCTPEIRTPWCGRPGCRAPEQHAAAPPPPPLAIDLADLIDLLAADNRNKDSKARTKAQLAKALDSYVDDRVRLAIEGIRSRRRSP